MADRYTPCMLQVSTMHIRKSTAEALARDLADREGPLWNNLSYVAWHSYGWIIWVDMDMLTILVDSGYADLAKLFEEAHSQGCVYLQLDRDGTVYPDLDQYEW